MKRREFMSLSGAALSAPAAMARRPSSKKPNILLLMADQLRGDCLGADGNNDIQTPNLDRLASEGGKLVLRPESLLYSPNYPEEIRAEDLPGWDNEDQSAIRAFGDLWHDQRRTAVLLVPSVATNGIERNLILNPAHPAFPSIRAGKPHDVKWNTRLFE